MKKVLKAMLKDSPKFLTAGIIWGIIFGVLAYLLGATISTYVATGITFSVTLAGNVFLSVLLTWVFGGMLLGIAEHFGNFDTKGWITFALAYFLGATVIGIFKTLSVSFNIGAWIMAIVWAVILGYVTQYMFSKLKI